MSDVRFIQLLVLIRRALMMIVGGIEKIYPEVKKES